MNVRKFLLQSGIKIDKFLASTKLFRSSGGKSNIVFFPGCSLSGYNPDYVFKVRDYLKCGILTGCCAKPLKLMGETKTFQSRIEGIKSELDKINAENVITACQNCYKILKEYDKKRNILSLWPLMLEKGLPDELRGKFNFLEASVQDSCSSTPEIITSIREILKYLGVNVREFPGKQKKCCGGIQAIVTGNSDEYKRKRAEKSPCNVIISYCASCRSAMSIDGAHKSIHILDLIFGDGEISMTNSDIVNRFLLARRLNKGE